MIRYGFLGIALCFTLQATLEEAQQLRAAGNHTQAIQAFEKTIQEEPENGTVHFEYAMYLVERDQKKNYEKTIQLLERACAIKEDINWLFQLGCQGCRYGQLNKSIQAYERILKKYPHQFSALYNLGYTYKCMGKTARALDIYQQVLAKNPEYEAAHLGIAFGYIGLGDFKRGWHEHAWNLKKQKKYAAELRHLVETNSVAGKTVLLTPEGGLGDSIHFLRYVQLLKQKGARTVVAIQKELVPLCSRCDYIDHLVASRSNQAIPAYHASCTLMSLAPLFAHEEHEMPQNIPYITPDPERMAYWQEQLKTDRNFKIGICWQPSIHNDVSRLPIARRGIPLSQFYTLASTPGVSVYSLQCIEGLEQLEHVPEHVTIHTLDETFDKKHGPFMDTAAVIKQMDLVISADTATAHIAGAMGCPVWLLLAYVTDWRWLIKRTDNPWYPTMRIFKQPAPFDWDSMMHELHQVFFTELFHQ